MQRLQSASAEKLESDIQKLKRRAYRAWDDEYLSRIKAKRIACGTFTLKTSRKQSVLVQLIDEYFFKLAKRQNRHFVVMFGLEPDGTNLRQHIQADIFILPNEGKASIDDIDLWMMESQWIHGKVEVAKHRGGRSLAYAVAKHDGNSEIMKVYCPKSGDCKKSRKNGNRLYCKYRRNPHLLIL